MDEKEEVLLKNLAVSQMTTTAFMMYLNEKGLLKQAQEFVDGFLKNVTQDELEALALHLKGELDALLAKRKGDA